MIFNEFKDKEGEVVVGTVQRQEGYLVLVDIGKVTAILPPHAAARSTARRKGPPRRCARFRMASASASRTRIAVAKDG